MGITNKDVLKTVAIDVPNLKTQMDNIDQLEVNLKKFYIAPKTWKGALLDAIDSADSQKGITIIIPTVTDTQYLDVADSQPIIINKPHIKIKSKASTFYPVLRGLGDLIFDVRESGFTLENVTVMGNGNRSYGNCINPTTQAFEGSTTGIRYGVTTFSGGNKDNMRCDNVRFVACKQGILSYERNLVVKDCDFSQCHTGIEMIGYSGYENRNYIIQNNRFHGCGTDGTNNDFTSFCIKFDLGINISEVQINDNHFDSVVNGILGKARNGQICNNHFGRSYGTLIDINCIDMGFLIDGNETESTTGTITATRKQYGYGIYTRGNNIKVSNNTMSKLGKGGIYVDSHYTQVTDNFIQDCSCLKGTVADDGQDYHGIHINKNYCLVDGNMVRNTLGVNGILYGINNVGSETTIGDNILQARTSKTINNSGTIRGNIQAITSARGIYWNASSYTPTSDDNNWQVGDIMYGTSPLVGRPFAKVCTSISPLTFENCGIVGMRQASSMANSNVSDVANLQNNFNTLLQRLRDANILLP